MMDVNKIYWGDHFTAYTNIKPVYGTPKTNIMLYVSCI